MDNLMKKNNYRAITLFTLSICLIPVGQAGTVGDAQTHTAGITPFVGIEGSYNWVDYKKGSIADSESNLNNEPWGGRVSAGFTVPYSERISFSNEIAWGYYGEQTKTDKSNNFSSNNKLYGFDLLVGINYRYYQTDWFIKAGALALNRSTNRSVSNDTVDINLALSKTEVLPEIKVGGLYEVTDHVGVSLAYMHAFGAQHELTTYASESTPLTIHGNIRNPSIDAILLGLRYTI